MMIQGVWTKAPCGESGWCVEVNAADGAIRVRDSKQGQDGPVLTFTPEEWRAFGDGVRSGLFDV